MRERLASLLRRVRDLRRLKIVVGRLRGWTTAAELTLARRFGLATREDRIFFLLVPAVGVLAGTLGVAVHALIDAVSALLWGPGGDLIAAAESFPWWQVIAATTCGGLVVGLIAWWGKEQVSGMGMSVLLESVALRGGRLPGKPMILRALAAVATVGAGGSLGREGPLIRLGAMISSVLGSRFGLPPHRIKILLGCGAAAGLAAVYNIPVGGALFAMEVILGNFALEIFGPIVASSVISTLIARSVEGNLPLFPAPGYELTSAWEIVACLGLGVVGAFASVVFVVGIRSGSSLFSRMAFLPYPLRPAFGMALLGGLALVYPSVLGSGVHLAAESVAGSMSLKLLVLLALAKLLATSLTVGSGGAGGLFTPSLAFGALVGGAFGVLLGQTFPFFAGGSGAYAVVGMAAILAGTTHAPISAVLILFEFTGNYDLIIPLMVAAMTASMLASRLLPYSIYTESLRRKGIDISLGMEEVALAGLTVSDLMRADEHVLGPADDYRVVTDKFLSTHRQQLFVVDEAGRLEGVVSLHDIKHVLDDPSSLTHILALDLVGRVEKTLGPSERLHRVAEHFARHEEESLPVVEPETQEYLGLLSKRDLLAIYAQEVLGRPSKLATFVHRDGSETSRSFVELPADYTIRLVEIPTFLVGRTLSEARLPQEIGARVIEIVRPAAGGRKERLIPDADTELYAGDGLILLGPKETISVLRWGDLEDPES